MSNLGPQFTQAYAHPRDLSDEDFHAHLVQHHGYHPDEIRGSGEATGLQRRAALTDLHNWSHQATNYALDHEHGGESPYPGEDLPHHHPDWQPGRTYSFNQGAVDIDTGNQAKIAAKQDGNRWAL